MTLEIQKTNLLETLNNNNEVIVNNEETKHLFSKQDLLAVWAAYQAGRPLLLRGKPGTGKSQFAKAIAGLLKWSFVKEVLHGSTQLEDLHWQYDAINRLGEAQSLAYTKTMDIEERLAHSRFIRPGAFWWAFDWASANACYPEKDSNAEIRPHSPKNWDATKQGVVLLIDEIDKAEPDLPNGLLQTLGDLEFNVPYIHKNIKATGIKPLIIITTNEERELPSALVRRCYTHTLKMEEGDNKHEWLIKRGELHFGNDISQESYQQAAKLLWQDRNTEMRYPPGLAEYLDLLRPLSKLPKTEQEERLALISGFVYNKEAED